MESNIDGGWAWFVLISTFLSCINLACLFYNIGVLNVAFLQNFEKDVATTSIIGSVFSSLFFLSGPLASIMVNRFSCRVAHVFGGILAFVGFSCGYFVDRLELFILTYSVFAGVGLSICYMVTIVVLSFNFEKRLGFSVGLTTAGGGIGILISGPFCQYLLDTYGLHGTFLILGALALNEIVFGAVMRPTVTEKRHFTERNKSSYKDGHNKLNELNCSCNHLFQFNIFKKRPFVIILICDFLWTLPYSIIIFHLPNLSVVNGYTEEQAALLITALGLGSTFSRQLTGLSLGPGGLDPVVLFAGSSGILAILTLTFPMYSYAYTGQMIFSFLFGIYTGSLTTIRNPLCMELAGLKYLSTAIGLIFLVGGIAFIIGPPIAGLAVDNTGSYGYSFFLSGFILIIACLLSLTSSISIKQQSTEDLPNPVFTVAM